MYYIHQRRRQSLILLLTWFGVSLLSTEGFSACSMTNNDQAVDITAADPSYNKDIDNDGDMRFGKFLIPKTSIFCKSPSSAAFVNLRPIVPGHVLVMPRRITPLLADLSTEEYADLWLLVRRVQTILKRHYPGTTAFNVAVQDGKAAGQSVPHVHVHILPRQGGDFDRNDDIYEALEEWVPKRNMSKARTDIEVPDDKDRMDRTMEMMSEEAAAYMRILREIDRQETK